MITYAAISKIHLEISTRCNASCPLCPRNLSGYDAELGYPIHSMSLEEAKKLFPLQFVNQLTDILINGNFGDFVTAKEGLDIVQYFAASNPNLQILISTNGSARPGVWWAKLGAIPNVTIGFALDGMSDTHERYRRNTSWRVVINNARSFIAAGGKAIWRMVKFDHNVHQLAECEAMSKQLGFSRFEILADGRDFGPVYDAEGNFTHKLGDDANFRNTPYPASIVTWTGWTTPLATPESRLKEYKTLTVKPAVSCYTKRMSEIYITATGEVYPCCWLGMYPKLKYKHAWQTDNFQVAELALNNDAHEHGLEKAIEWFNSVEAAWQKKSYEEGRIFKCDQYCGVNA